ALPGEPGEKEDAHRADCGLQPREGGWRQSAREQLDLDVALVMADEAEGQKDHRDHVVGGHDLGRAVERVIEDEAPRHVDHDMQHHQHERDRGEVRERTDRALDESMVRKHATPPLTSVSGMARPASSASDAIGSLPGPQPVSKNGPIPVAEPAYRTR